MVKALQYRPLGKSYTPEVMEQNNVWHSNDIPKASFNAQEGKNLMRKQVIRGWAEKNKPLDYITLETQM